MNGLSSRARKIAYVVGIVVLLIPIVLLGQPAGKAGESEGHLSKLRDKYDLGESTLGNVDPSSSAMNLVLLGLRGPAASILQLEAKELQKTKNWGKMRALVDTITQLQPHYVKVWQFEGWNLAYNVSSAWDATEDRYYWVKEGIKFQDDGVDRNQKNAALVHNTARLVGWKIGAADEWRFFRKYFIKDPDVKKFDNGPDLEINPETKDNYLVSKGRFVVANEVEANYGQSGLQKELFRQYPYRSQIEYAATLQKEGRFDETTRYAWELAHSEWTTVFGQEMFFEGNGGSRVRYSLGSYFSDDDTVPDGETEELIRLAKENFPDMPEDEAVDLQQRLTWANIKTVNYAYWRQLTSVEKTEKMVNAHRLIFLGKQKFRKGLTSPRGENGDQPSEAREVLEQGMKLLDEVFRENPDLVDDSLIDEAMMATQYWRYIHDLEAIDLPDKFYLFEIWVENQHKIQQVKRDFQRENEPER